MQQDAPKVRLFVEADLAEGATVALERAQAHYLFTVMRLGPGDAAALFNGRDGEWRAVAAEAGRKRGALVCARRLRPQAEGPDLDLIFAPIRKARTDFIAEKACELGARRLIPCLTRFTNAERVNVARLRAHAVEAAEQCEILSVPEVLAPASLSTVLDGWQAGRRLMVCDEARDAAPALDALRAACGGRSPGPWAVLIGPEGGFAAEERARLAACPFVTRVSLGPRVLRADTAAVAALALWQAALGDWRGDPAPGTMPDPAPGAMPDPAPGAMPDPAPGAMPGPAP